MLGSISTCGTIKIVKDAEPASRIRLQLHHDGRQPLGGAASRSIRRASTTKTFTNVKKGNYSVTESSPPRLDADRGHVPLGHRHVRNAERHREHHPWVRRPRHVHLREQASADADREEGRRERQWRDEGRVRLLVPGERRRRAGFEADGQNDLTVDPGTYNVTEPAVAGYATTYDGCSNVGLALGETKTCTITNNDQPATLIVKKVVVNDNGGTKVASDFSFQVNGGAARRRSRPTARTT